MTKHVLPRRIKQAELAHLRELVAEYQARLDANEARIAELKRDRDYWADCADRWREDTLQAINDAGCEPGLTVDGRLIPVQLAELAATTSLHS